MDLDESLYASTFHDNVPPHARRRQPHNFSAYENGLAANRINKCQQTMAKLLNVPCPPPIQQQYTQTQSTAQTNNNGFAASPSLTAAHAPMGGGSYASGSHLHRRRSSVTHNVPSCNSHHVDGGAPSGPSHQPAGSTAQHLHTTTASQQQQQHPQLPRVCLAVSGGGSRAIISCTAFMDIMATPISVLEARVKEQQKEKQKQQRGGGSSSKGEAEDGRRPPLVSGVKEEHMNIKMLDVVSHLMGVSGGAWTSLLANCRRSRRNFFHYDKNLADADTSVMDVGNGSAISSNDSLQPTSSSVLSGAGRSGGARRSSLFAAAISLPQSASGGASGGGCGVSSSTISASAAPAVNAPNPWLFGPHHFFDPSRHLYAGLKIVLGEELVKQSLGEHAINGDLTLCTTALSGTGTRVENYSKFVARQLIGQILEDGCGSTSFASTSVRGKNVAVYAGATGAYDNFKFKLSDLQPLIANGDFPFVVASAIGNKEPILPSDSAAVRAAKERNRHHKYDWIEFSPFFIRSPTALHYTEEVDESAVYFIKGREHEEVPDARRNDIRLHQVLAMIGSAFAADRESILAMLPNNVARAGFIAATNFLLHEKKSYNEADVLLEGCLATISFGSHPKAMTASIRDAGVDINIAFPALFPKHANREFDVILAVDASINTPGANELFIAIKRGYVSLDSELDINTGELLPLPTKRMLVADSIVEEDVNVPHEDFGGDYFKVYVTTEGTLIIYALALRTRSLFKYVVHDYEIDEDVALVMKTLSEVPLVLLRCLQYLQESRQHRCEGVMQQQPSSSSVSQRNQSGDEVSASAMGLNDDVPVHGSARSGGGVSWKFPASGPKMEHSNDADGDGSNTASPGLSRAPDPSVSMERQCSSGSNSANRQSSEPTTPNIGGPSSPHSSSDSPSSVRGVMLMGSSNNPPPIAPNPAPSPPPLVSVVSGSFGGTVVISPSTNFAPNSLGINGLAATQPTADDGNITNSANAANDNNNNTNASSFLLKAPIVQRKRSLSDVVVQRNGAQMRSRRSSTSFNSNSNLLFEGPLETNNTMSSGSTNGNCGSFGIGAGGANGDPFDPYLFVAAEEEDEEDGVARGEQQQRLRRGLDAPLVISSELAGKNAESSPSAPVFISGFSGNTRELTLNPLTSAASAQLREESAYPSSTGPSARTSPTQQQPPPRNAAFSAVGKQTSAATATNSMPIATRMRLNRVRPPPALIGISAKVLLQQGAANTPAQPSEEEEDPLTEADTHDDNGNEKPARSFSSSPTSTQPPTHQMDTVEGNTDSLIQKFLFAERSLYSDLFSKVPQPSTPAEASKQSERILKLANAILLIFEEESVDFFCCEQKKRREIIVADTLGCTERVLHRLRVANQKLTRHGLVPNSTHLFDTLLRYGVLRRVDNYTVPTGRLGNENSGGGADAFAHPLLSHEVTNASLYFSQSWLDYHAALAAVKELFPLDFETISAGNGSAAAMNSSGSSSNGASGVSPAESADEQALKLDSDRRIGDAVHHGLLYHRYAAIISHCFSGSKSKVKGSTAEGLPPAPSFGAYCELFGVADDADKRQRDKRKHSHAKKIISLLRVFDRPRSRLGAVIGSLSSHVARLLVNSPEKHHHVTDEGDGPMNGAEDLQIHHAIAVLLDRSTSFMARQYLGQLALFTAVTAKEVSGGGGSGGSKEPVRSIQRQMDTFQSKASDLEMMVMAMGRSTCDYFCELLESQSSQRDGGSLAADEDPLNSAMSLSYWESLVLTCFTEALEAIYSTVAAPLGISNGGGVGGHDTHSASLVSPQKHMLLLAEAVAGSTHVASYMLLRVMCDYSMAAHTCMPLLVLSPQEEAQGEMRASSPTAIVVINDLIAPDTVEPPVPSSSATTEEDTIILRAATAPIPQPHIAPMDVTALHQHGLDGTALRSYSSHHNDDSLCASDRLPSMTSCLTPNSTTMPSNARRLQYLLERNAMSASVSLRNMIPITTDSANTNNNSATIHVVVKAANGPRSAAEAAHGGGDAVAGDGQYSPPPIGTDSAALLRSPVQPLRVVSVDSRGHSHANSPAAADVASNLLRLRQSGALNTSGNGADVALPDFSLDRTFSNPNSANPPQPRAVTTERAMIGGEDDSAIAVTILPVGALPTLSFMNPFERRRRKVTKAQQPPQQEDIFVDQNPLLGRLSHDRQQEQQLRSSGRGVTPEKLSGALPFPHPLDNTPNNNNGAADCILRRLLGLHGERFGANEEGYLRITAALYKLVAELPVADNKVGGRGETSSPPQFSIAKQKLELGLNLLTSLSPLFDMTLMTATLHAFPTAITALLREACRHIDNTVETLSELRSLVFDVSGGAIVIHRSSSAAAMSGGGQLSSAASAAGGGVDNGSFMLTIVDNPAGVAGGVGFAAANAAAAGMGMSMMMMSLRRSMNSTEDMRVGDELPDGGLFHRVSEAQRVAAKEALARHLLNTLSSSVATIGGANFFSAAVPYRSLNSGSFYYQSMFAIYDVMCGALPMPHGHQRALALVEEVVLSVYETDRKHFNFYRSLMQTRRLASAVASSCTSRSSRTIINVLGSDGSSSDGGGSSNRMSAPNSAGPSPVIRTPPSQQNNATTATAEGGGDVFGPPRGVTRPNSNSNGNNSPSIADAFDRDLLLLLTIPLHQMKSQEQLTTVLGMAKLYRDVIRIHLEWRRPPPTAAVASGSSSMPPSQLRRKNSVVGFHADVQNNTVTSSTNKNTSSSAAEKSKHDSASDSVAILEPSKASRSTVSLHNDGCSFTLAQQHNGAVSSGALSGGGSNTSSTKWALLCL